MPCNRKHNFTDMNKPGLYRQPIQLCKGWRTTWISCFRSVVVITFASHAKGPRFETGRKQAFSLFFPPGGVPSHWQNQQARKARGAAGDAAGGRGGDHLQVSLFSARRSGGGRIRSSPATHHRA